jgi:hypothetical protein
MMLSLGLMVKLVDLYVRGFNVDTDGLISRDGWKEYARITGWSLVLAGSLILIEYVTQT